MVRVPSGRSNMVLFGNNVSPTLVVTPPYRHNQDTPSARNSRALLSFRRLHSRLLASTISLRVARLPRPRTVSILAAHIETTYHSESGPRTFHFHSTGIHSFEFPGMLVRWLDRRAGPADQWCDCEIRRSSK